MKLKIFFVIILCSLTLSVSAATIYKIPAFVVTYIDDGRTGRAINYIGIGMPVPVKIGSSRTLTINIKNNRLRDFQPNILINIRHQHASIGGDGGIVDVEYHDSPDYIVGNGCEGTLPIGATCSIVVTFTPVAPPGYDGGIQSTAWETLRVFDGYYVMKEFSLVGWYQP